MGNMAFLKHAETEKWSSPCPSPWLSGEAASLGVTALEFSLSSPQLGVGSAHVLLWGWAVLKWPDDCCLRDTGVSSGQARGALWPGSFHTHSPPLPERLGLPVTLHQPHLEIRSSTDGHTGFEPTLGYEEGQIFSSWSSRTSSWPSPTPLHLLWFAFFSEAKSPDSLLCVIRLAACVKAPEIAPSPPWPKVSHSRAGLETPLLL